MLCFLQTRIDTAAAAVTAIIGMTTPSLQPDFGNLLQHLGHPSQTVNDGRLAMAGSPQYWPWSVSLRSQVSSAEKEEEDGKHRTSSESQASEFYPYVATQRCNPMKPRFISQDTNAMLAGFDAADGDPPPAKKAEGVVRLPAAALSSQLG